MMDIWEALRAPFPREAIHWRAQTLNKAGDKAMALAYIDARDVMRRLDDVVGPPHWQDSFTETPKGRVICSLSIFYEGAWITKSDGAGDTDVEGEKGGISDALKRAAVKWGIGRYLYDMPAPWVPCECYEAGGKKRWKRWTVDPWSFVRNESSTETDAAKVARDRGRLEAAENRDTLHTTFGMIGHEWFPQLPAELIELKSTRYAKFARDDLALCKAKDAFDETCISIRDHFGGWSKIPHELMEAIKSKKAEFPEPKETEE